MSIICAKCKEPGRVVDSRRHGQTMWRRRECCGERWTTIEYGNNDELHALRAEVAKYKQMIHDIRAALGGKAL